MISHSIGARIRGSRIAKSWSLNYLAKKTGLSKNAIFKIETGAAEVRLSNLKKIARILEVDPLDLIGDELGKRSRTK